MNHKKSLQTILLVLFLVPFLFPIVVFAEETSGGSSGGRSGPLDYVLLAPLPEIDPHLSGDNILETHLAMAFRIFISLAIVLTVIMIIVGGVEYLSTDAVSQKGEGKKKINNALTGLMLALLSVLLLTLIGGTALTDFSIRIPGLDPPPEIAPPAPPEPITPSVDGCFSALMASTDSAGDDAKRYYCEEQSPPQITLFALSLPHPSATPPECEGGVLDDVYYDHAQTVCQGFEGEWENDTSSQGSYASHGRMICLIENEDCQSAY